MVTYVEIAPDELKDMFIEQIKKQPQFAHQVLTRNMFSLKGKVDENGIITEFRIGIDMNKKPLVKVMNRN